jgi:hypothetical protein
MTQLFDRYKNLSQEQLQRCFYASCRSGYLDEVKYLLTSSDLNEHADIYANEGDALIFAVENGHYEVIEYLLHSPELKEHINIHTQYDLAIIKACDIGNKDMVKFLLTSPKLKEHSDIHTRGTQLYFRKDRPFLTAYICERMEVLEYLILDYNIKLTDGIKQILKDDPKEITPKLENMFKMRDIHKQLTNDLSINEITSTVSKKTKL